MNKGTIYKTKAGDMVLVLSGKSIINGKLQALKLDDNHNIVAHNVILVHPENLREKRGFIN